MSYTALSFEIPGDEADAWEDALLDAGALSVETSDADAGTVAEQALYGEPGEPVEAHWPRARLVALIPTGVDAGRVLDAAARALGRGVPASRGEAVAEKDWVRATQAQFGPIAVGNRLHIVPSWCEAPGEGIAIRLDPGLAFGTGSHPTTRLCLEWLLEHVEAGRSLLDYGCGSGILAIAAAKLGAAPVVGTDVDTQALAASAENARLNAADAHFVTPDALAAGTFDVVVANILANPLILLAPALAARVASGGSIALAGILEAQVADVIVAYERWFKLAAWRADDGWVLVAGERCDASGGEWAKTRR